MARFFLLFFLIVAVPLQGLAVPHRHEENVAGQPIHHHQAPHFHLWFLAHSHHDDAGSQEKPGHPVQDSSHEHDDDAIYVSGDLVIDQTQSSGPRVDFEDASLEEAIISNVPQNPCQERWTPPPDYGGLPLFLKTASLRL